MKSRVLQFGIAAVAAGLGLQPLTASAAQGDWLIRGGIGIVDPKSNSLRLSPEATLQVDAGTSATIEGTWMFADQWGVELLAAYPFTHDVDLDGGEGAGKVAEVDHLPPTLSVQYHFSPDSNIRPYVGLGLNYTTFSNEKTSGALTGTDLSLDDSWGFAAQVGTDVSIGGNWFLNGVVRYIDIDADADLDGDFIGKVEIDPIVYQLQVGYRFGKAGAVRDRVSRD